MRFHKFTALIVLVSALEVASAEVVDLTPKWDRETVLANPDKGWYHHYYDNGIDKYLLKRDADLDRFSRLRRPVAEGQP
jgi:hypothetical protein